MQPSTIRFSVALCSAVALSTIQSGAHAQGLIQTAGNYIINAGDPVPDVNGVPIPGVTFATTTVEVPSVDDNGFMLCQARITGTGVVNNSALAYFYGSSAANLKMVVRGQDAAPGLPGVIIGTTSVSGLSTSVRLTPNGTTFWSSTVSGPTIGLSNDTALFGGLPGALSLYAQEGDTAPSTSNAKYSSSFTGLGLFNAALNDNGVMAFKSTLTAGDVVGSTNNEGYFHGLPGALVLAVRKGLTQFSGADIGSFNGGLQMNNAGQFMYECTLSTTSGSPPATTASNWVVAIYTPGFGSTAIVREGDTAPGTVGATFVNSGNDNWSPFRGNPCFTRSGKTAFMATVNNGDVTAGVNDLGIWAWNGSTLSLVARRGDNAPGTDVVFNGFTANSIQILDDGRIVFVAALTGGTSTTANDSGIWFGQPGNLALAVREGDSAQGSGGGSHAAMGGSFMAANDLGQIMFTTQLFPSTNPGIYVWDVATGAIPIILNSEVVDIGGGNMRTIASLSSAYQGANNSDGAASGFSNDGVLALRLSFASPFSSDRSLVMIKVPKNTPSSSFCLGDGTGTACPCANSGSAGHGCASSSFAGGARLVSSGIAGASAGTDTLVLTANDIPGPGLFFQGDGQFGGGLGLPFGDGLICAGGNILRLGVVFPTGTTASYPGGLTPNPIHIGGATTSGDVRHYQCWYRDAAVFCSSDTYNLTQGLTLTWGP
ncbi:MAG: hypothetical protein JNL28_16635 [Planctomycetes bacterium]|nr:hypothetical protein [Planctomycetota bacterium]